MSDKKVKFDVVNPFGRLALGGGPLESLSQRVDRGLQDLGAEVGDTVELRISNKKHTCACGAIDGRVKEERTSKKVRVTFLDVDKTMRPYQFYSHKYLFADLPPMMPKPAPAPALKQEPLRWWIGTNMVNGDITRVLARTTLDAVVTAAKEFGVSALYVGANRLGR